MVGSINYHRNVILKVWIDQLPPTPSFPEGEQCHLFVFFDFPLRAVELNLQCKLSASSVT